MNKHSTNIILPLPAGVGLQKDRSYLTLNQMWLGTVQERI